jgi:hypothetical protein
VFRDIQYIDPSLFAKPDRARITMSHWCSNCGIRHEYTFSLEEVWVKNEEVPEDKELKVRVHTHSFFSGGEKFNKKLRLKDTHTPNKEKNSGT